MSWAAWGDRRHGHTIVTSPAWERSRSEPRERARHEGWGDFEGNLGVRLLVDSDGNFIPSVGRFPRAEIKGLSIGTGAVRRWSVVSMRRRLVRSGFAFLGGRTVMRSTGTVLLIFGPEFIVARPRA